MGNPLKGACIKASVLILTTAAVATSKAEMNTAEVAAFKTYVFTVQVREWAALCGQDVPDWKKRFEPEVADWMSQKNDLINKGRLEVQKMLEQNPKAVLKSVADIDELTKKDVRSAYAVLPAERKVDACLKLGQVLETEVKKLNSPKSE